MRGFGQDFEVEVQVRLEAGVWSLFCCYCFVDVMKLNLGRNSEARFVLVNILNFLLSRDAWSIF